MNENQYGVTFTKVTYKTLFPLQTFAFYHAPVANLKIFIWDFMW